MCLIDWGACISMIAVWKLCKMIGYGHVVRGWQVGCALVRLRKMEWARMRPKIHFVLIFVIVHLMLWPNPHELRLIWFNMLCYITHIILSPNPHYLLLIWFGMFCFICHLMLWQNPHQLRYMFWYVFFIWIWTFILISTGFFSSYVWADWMCMVDAETPIQLFARFLIW